MQYFMTLVGNKKLKKEKCKHAIKKFKNKLIKSDNLKHIFLGYALFFCKIPSRPVELCVD